MIVSSVKEAWELASRLFPTDYEKDEDRSSRAGYPIYYSTAEGMNAWISDLNNRLELNYSNGESENIWIVQDEGNYSKLSYKIFITDSNEAASLIARGMSNEPVKDCVQISHGSASGSAFSEMIPEIYKKHGKFYAALVYRPENGKPEYELTLC